VVWWDRNRNFEGAIMKRLLHSWGLPTIFTCVVIVLGVYIGLCFRNLEQTIIRVELLDNRTDHFEAELKLEQQ